MSTHNQSEILTLLQGASAPLSISEICARLDGSPSQVKVRAALRSLRDAGQVEMIGQRRGAKYAICAPVVA